MFEKMGNWKKYARIYLKLIKISFGLYLTFLKFAKGEILNE